MSLDLFHRWECPYCATVRDFIEDHELGAKVDYVEIDEIAGAVQLLERLTGKAQVPCLMINGAPLLEATEIIKWLRRDLLRSHLESPQSTLAP